MMPPWTVLVWGWPLQRLFVGRCELRTVSQQWLSSLQTGTARVDSWQLASTPIL